MDCYYCIDRIVCIDFFFLVLYNGDFTPLRSAGGWFDSVFSYPSVPQHADRQRWQTETDRKTEKPISAREERDVHILYVYYHVYVNNNCDSV